MHHLSFSCHYKYECLDNTKTISGDTVVEVSQACKAHSIPRIIGFYFRPKHQLSAYQRKNMNKKSRNRRDWAREYPVYHNTPLEKCRNAKEFFYFSYFLHQMASLMFKKHLPSLSAYFFCTFRIYVFICLKVFAKNYLHANTITF